MKPSISSESPQPLAVCLPPDVKQMLRGVLRELEHPFSVLDSRISQPPAGLPDGLRADWLGYQALEQASLISQIGGRPDAVLPQIAIAGDKFEQTCLFTIAVQTREKTTLDLLRVPFHKILGTLRQIVERLPQIDLPVAARVEETLPVAFSSTDLWSLEETGWHETETWPAGGLLSGSFFPLHAGHRHLRDVASELISQAVRFELTAWNADKPPLDHISLSRRLGQFSPGEVCVTSLPTFVEKSSACPGSTFVIGWDTALRVLDERFYAEKSLNSALDAIAERECRFLVAARRSRNRVRTLSELTIPSRYTNLFEAIPTTRFLEEVSSTDLRELWWRGQSTTPLPKLFPQ